MKENTLDNLRQQDDALCEALRQDEAELPQMPADLNARLMKRVTCERRKPRRIVCIMMSSQMICLILLKRRI